MDTLRLEIGMREDPVDGIVDAVNIFVNDRNLLDILREVEIPCGKREGKPNLAGRYVGRTSFCPRYACSESRRRITTTTVTKARSPSLDAGAASRDAGLFGSG